MPADFVGFRDLQSLLEVDAESRAGGAADGGTLTQHDMCAATYAGMCGGKAAARLPPWASGQLLLVHRRMVAVRVHPDHAFEAAEAGALVGAQARLGRHEFAGQAVGGRGVDAGVA